MQIKYLFEIYSGAGKWMVGFEKCVHLSLNFRGFRYFLHKAQLQLSVLAAEI